MTASKPGALSPLSLHPQWLSVLRHKSNSRNVRIGERTETTPLSISLTMEERVGKEAGFSVCKCTPLLRCCVQLCAPNRELIRAQMQHSNCLMAEICTWPILLGDNIIRGVSICTYQGILGSLLFCGSSLARYVFHSLSSWQRFAIPSLRLSSHTFPRFFF